MSATSCDRRRLTRAVNQEMVRVPTIVFAFLSLTGCMDIECTNEPSEVVVSPDGTKKVVVFSRNCGATTGFNMQGTVMERTEALPDSSGSAFIIDHGTAKVSWADNTKILVILESRARVFKKELSDYGISIEYQLK
jgi:hypothetical protein